MPPKKVFHLGREAMHQRLYLSLAADGPRLAARRTWCQQQRVDHPIVIVWAYSAPPASNLPPRIDSLRDDDQPAGGRGNQRVQVADGPVLPEDLVVHVAAEVAGESYHLSAVVYGGGKAIWVAGNVPQIQASHRKPTGRRDPPGRRRQGGPRRSCSDRDMLRASTRLRLALVVDAVAEADATRTAQGAEGLASRPCTTGKGSSENKVGG